MTWSRSSVARSEVMARAGRELHSRVDGANYAGMEGIEKAISSLMAELTFVEKASTWPWQTRTLRGFVTAVLLPLVLWSIQQTLIRIGIS